MPCYPRQSLSLILLASLSSAAPPLAVGHLLDPAMTAMQDLVRLGLAILCRPSNLDLQHLMPRYIYLFRWEELMASSEAERASKMV